MEIIFQKTEIQISKEEQNRIIQAKIDELYSELTPALWDFFSRKLYGNLDIKIEAGNVVQIDNTIKKRLCGEK